MFVSSMADSDGNINEKRLCIDYLGDQNILSILFYLDVQSTLVLSTCNFFFYEISTSNCLWKAHCDRAFAPKVYCPFSRQQGNLKSVFFRSHLLKTLNMVTSKDLCSMVWNFRFKEEAGMNSCETLELLCEF